MSEGEQPVVRPAFRALLQVVAAGVVGLLVLPQGLTVVFVAGWAGGGGSAVVAGGLLVAVVVALLVGAASLAPEASRLTRTIGGRVCWALLVAVSGAMAWSFAAYAGIGAPWSALPCALAAGLLLRRWYFKVGAAALAVVSVVGLLGALAETVPDELDARLAAAHVERGGIFVTDIPGYHRVEHQRSFEPDDPGSVPPQRHLELLTHPDDATGDCQPDPRDSRLMGAPCAVEEPGLTYTAGVTEHQYAHRRGTTRLRIVAPLAVDRAVLRAAILTARPTARPDRYTTEVDGYETMDVGAAPSVFLQVEDKAQLPMAKLVEISESPVPQAGTCAEFRNSGTPSPYLECVEERPGLHYERL